MKNTYYFTLFFLLAFSFSAEANEFRQSTSVEVASVFYKLTGQEPNFTSWAKSTDSYQKAKLYDKQKTLADEEIKLREVFYNVFEDEPILVQTFLPLKSYSDNQGKFFFQDFHEDTFFSYEAFGESFALIVPEMVQFKAVEIEPEMAGQLIESSRAGGARVELTIMPAVADAKSPVDLYGVPQWPLFGKLAEFRLWDHKGETLYSFYRADWYENSNELDDLYQR